MLSRIRRWIALYRAAPRMLRALEEARAYLDAEDRGQPVDLVLMLSEVRAALHAAGRWQP